MVKKSYLGISLLIVLVLLLVGCAPVAQPTAAAVPVETKPTAQEPAKQLKICATLSGMLGDKSYNDKFNEGITKAINDFGVSAKLLEVKGTEDYESNLTACAAGGYDFVIAMGPAYRDLIQVAAKDFPEVKFAITDAIINPAPTNLMSIAFAPNEGQFLVGAAMAMLTTKTDIPGINKEKVVGWITGGESPNINDFWIGFEQGVKYIDPEIEILKGVTGSFADPIKGKEFALAQYEQGADVIAQVAAGTGLGIIEAANEQKLFVVGVDSNQDNLAPGYVVTSMLKHIDIGVYQAIKSILDGTFKGGGYQYMDLSTGGIALTDYSTFKQFWGDKFPEDIKAKTDELAQKIISGEIKVNTQPGIRPWENK